MKRSLKLAVAASVLATPAMADVAGASAYKHNNLENPLFTPSKGQLYSKTGAGLMIKKADSTDAMIAKGHDGAIEFPILRAQEELGYGITNRLSVNGSFGYTHDGDIDRKGMHLGRLGLNYRVFEGLTTDGWVWDLYADAHLGGISEMKGAYTPTGFNYDNYSNGRWGFYAGTKFGKTWDKLTVAAFTEILQTFGNANNNIDVVQMQDYAKNKIATSGNAALIAAAGGNATALTGLMTACNGGNLAACDGLQAIGMAGMTDSISVNLKSTLEWNVGLKAFYEMSDTWGLGGGFTYKHHTDNGIKSVATAQNNALSTLVADGLAAQMSNMEDGFDEYILSVSVAHQLTDTVQVALYGDYTFDTAHPNSQNGTDLKAELGVKLNVLF